MSDAIRAILDAVTDRVFAYRPKDKGEWAKRTERKVKRQRSRSPFGYITHKEPSGDNPERREGEG